VRRVVAVLVAIGLAAGMFPPGPAAADPVPRLTGTIAGTAWLDLDADAVLDASEAGLANVRVHLLAAGVDGEFGPES
jgi:hypothetical protein